MYTKLKKYSIVFFTTFALLLTSCDEDIDAGGTAVMKMAGDWWVTMEMIKDGENKGDAHHIGHFLMYTYNTAANKATEMWLEDDGNFWDYKLKVDVQYDKLTFSTKGFADNQAYDSQVKIEEGKIMEGAAKTPSGMPADSIYYKITFDDDDEGVYYIISGFRRTGFPGDDFH